MIPPKKKNRDYDERKNLTYTYSKKKKKKLTYSMNCVAAHLSFGYMLEPSLIIWFYNYQDKACFLINQCSFSASLFNFIGEYEIDSPIYIISSTFSAITEQILLLLGEKETEMGNERRWRCWRFFIVTGVAVADFLFLSGGASQLEQQKEHQPVVSRIAFGSCANQDVPQVLFFFSVFFLFLHCIMNFIYWSGWI